MQIKRGRRGKINLPKHLRKRPFQDERRTMRHFAFLPLLIAFWTFQTIAAQPIGGGSQSCNRQTDEFDGTTDIKCTQTLLKPLNESPRTTGRMVYNGGEKTYLLEVYFPGNISSEVLSAKKADLRVGSWQGELSTQTEVEKGSYTVSRTPLQTKQLRRIADSSEVKVRVGGYAYDISALQAHARLMLDMKGNEDE